MPHATPCLDCGRHVDPAVLAKGRCPSCRRQLDRGDFYQSPRWRRLAGEARRRGGSCAICGSTTRLIAHHRRARRDGGADDQGNLTLLCGAEAVSMPWDSCHNQYEADKRTGKDTPLRQLVEAL